MIKWLGLMAGVAMAGCSSETDGQSGGCADITGNYEVTVTKLSGSCPPGDGKASITIGSGAEGLYVLLPGVQGGCPGTLAASSCRFKAECQIVDTQNTSRTLATFNVDYTFSGATFSGSLVGALAPPIANPACDSTVKHEGKRL